MLVPPNYIEKDKDVVKRVTDTRQNSFTVTLIRGFFLQNEFGTVRTTGLIACRSDNCNFKGKSYTICKCAFRFMRTLLENLTNLEIIQTIYFLFKTMLSLTFTNFVYDITHTIKTINVQ